MTEQMFLNDAIEFPSRPSLEVGFAQSIIKYQDAPFWNREIDLLGILDGRTSNLGGRTGAAAARAGYHEIDTFVQKGLNDSPITLNSDATELLEDAFNHAHARIREETMKDPNDPDEIESGAAAAAVTLVHTLEDGRPGFSWAAVGDVQVGVFHEGYLEELNVPESEDGLLFNALGDWTFEGIEGLTEEQGVKQKGTHPLDAEDIGMISSDGLGLSREEKQAILQQTENPQQAARALVEAAKTKIPENTILAIMRTAQTPEKAAEKLAERAKIEVTKEEVLTIIEHSETPSQAAQTLINGAGICADEHGDDISVIVFRQKNEYMPGGNGTS